MVEAAEGGAGEVNASSRPDATGAVCADTAGVTCSSPVEPGEGTVAPAGTPPVRTSVSAVLGVPLKSVRETASAATVTGVATRESMATGSTTGVVS